MLSMDDKHDVTVASVQIDVVNGDVLATRAKVMQWVDQAAQAGADIVIFPELLLSAGYSLEDKFYDIAELIPGPSTHALGEKARQHNMYIIAGIAERDSTGTVYNSAFIVGRDGALVGSYRKTHIFSP